LPDTRSELALPLRVGNEIIGALDVQSVQPNAFGEDDMAVFQTMADQLAVAVRNAQLFEEAQAALEEVEELNRRLTGQAWGGFMSRQSPDMARTYRIADGTVSADPGGMPPDLLDQLQHTPLSRLEDDGDGELSVVVPIRVRGQVIGAFGFGGDELEHLSEEDIALIEAVAERVSIALENVRLFEQTQQQARREQMVNQITSKIVGSTDVGDILQITARELGKVLRSPKTSIQLHGDQDDES
jgi:GAF domain-containing protein